MKTILLIFNLLLSSLMYGQFILNGQAIQVSDSCFQLTSANDFEVGSIWYEDQINLNESFDIIMDIFLGCNNSNGADGIVFGLQPVGTSIGIAGEGIGFLGVTPSLAVEFDTWQNTNLDDPEFDHIAIIQNGSVNHFSGNGRLAGPIQAAVDNPNIENCDFHQIRISWNANLQTLTVYFDCAERLSYTGDIVNEIFSGNPEVFWGFTAATGGANNRHEVCFTYTSILDGFEDVTICPEGAYQLQISGGESYNWSPSIGLDNPNIPNPLASPEETTTYVVEVINDCSAPLYDTITVFVDGDTVRFDLGADTMLCQPNSLLLDADNGSPATYIWSDGNRNAQREIQNSGNYEVTVVLDDYCITQAGINVQVLPVPFIDLPTDTLLCEDASIELDAEINDPNASYVWSTGSTDSKITISRADTYEVLVENFCGTDSRIIQIENTNCRSLYAPNAFSPNFDGVNDVFRFYSDGDIKKVLTFKIYDRWGNLIYDIHNTSNLSDVFWDGTLNGKALDSNVFVWMLEVEYIDNITEILSGDITLLK